MKRLFIFMCMLFIVLTGCSENTSQPKDEIKENTNESQGEKEVLDITPKKEPEESTNEVTTMINQVMSSPIGQVSALFMYYDNESLKVSLTNIGTENFVFSIRHEDTENELARERLKPKESFEQIFSDLPKGIYDIYCYVEETGHLTVKVKTELVK